MALLEQLHHVARLLHRAATAVLVAVARLWLDISLLAYDRQGDTTSGVSNVPATQIQSCKPTAVDICLDATAALTDVFARAVDLGHLPGLKLATITMNRCLPLDKDYHSDAQAYTGAEHHL